MTKTKQTVEELLARRMEKVNKTKAEWERKDAYAKQMAEYAEKAKEIHLIEVEKADRMRERIAEGAEAAEKLPELQAIVDELRKTVITETQRKTNLDWMIAEDNLIKTQKQVEKTRDEVAKMYYGFA